jgi:hypothetical protein
MPALRRRRRADGNGDFAAAAFLHLFPSPYMALVWPDGAELNEELRIACAHSQTCLRVREAHRGPRDRFAASSRPSFAPSIARRSGPRSQRPDLTAGAGGIPYGQGTSLDLYPARASSVAQAVSMSDSSFLTRTLSLSVIGYAGNACQTDVLTRQRSRIRSLPVRRIFKEVDDLSFQWT